MTGHSIHIRTLCILLFGLFIGASASTSDNLILQLTEQEIQTLIDAEEQVMIDTGYYVSIENLNDLPTDNATYWFDYINEGGGAAVIDHHTGMFKPGRVDLLKLPNVWQGPYATYQPGRITLDGAGYDVGTLLDFWLNPYYLFTPIGLARPPSQTITQELYGDQFDRYAIVSLGPDGVKSADDIIRFFGGAPTALVVSSVNPASAEPGETITLRGYNFGDTQGDSQVVFNATNVSQIDSWSDRQIRFRVPPDAQSGYVKVVVGGQESNAVYLAVKGTQTQAENDWTLYY
ncbi:IPT/TIG domain-containing protein [Candidatus Sumerlaeota bacterium]|nr:IPT/TIG domain-containing protein [Candidatus Sumerlaeota bacterium]